MIESIILFPLQLILLGLLHLIFTFSRLISLISILPSLISIQFNSIRIKGGRGLNHYQEDFNEQLRLDSSRWNKTPNHLAIVFSPGRIRSNQITWNPFNNESRKSNIEEELQELNELNKLLIDVKLLLNWSKELNLTSLSIYDERGILERNSVLALKELAKDFSIPLEKLSSKRTNEGCTSFKVTLRQSQQRVKENESSSDGLGRETDSGCSVSSDLGEPISAASSITLVSTPLSSNTPSHLSVNFLSRLSGRPHLAHIAKEIARGIKIGSIDPKGLDRGLVEETIEASVVSEPDLLLVLGGPYLRLRGFPPWQLRLTEMHHHSSPSWLPTPPISYSILRKALDVYGGAEMRLGR